jgi:molybdate transport system substrate-binding protein
MLIRSLTTILASAIAIAVPDIVTASEIKVLSIPLKEPLDQIAPQFERATGHKLLIKYAPSGPLLKQIDGGEPFDVVLIFPNLVDDLIKIGKVEAGTRVDIARTGLGLAIKRGAAKPDIRTTDAFKRVLMTSSSISYAAQGPSGVHLVSVLDRLGIAQDVKPKLKPMGAGSLVVGPVARGEAEIGIVAIPFILAEAGAELAGPLPQELQDYVHYSSGIASATQDANAAKAFVSYFRQPRSVEALTSHGLEPTAQ